MKIITLLFIFISGIGFSQTVEIDKIKALDKKVYSKIIEYSYGDLDGDNDRELLLILNRFDSSENNIPRDLIILKRYDLSWNIWKKSSAIILGSDEGGIMGDPFQEAYIDSNKIYISQAGGSRWRWSENYIYRFKEETFLLESYSSYWGALCETKIEVEFNLSSGKIYYSEDIEDCPEGFGNNNHLLDSLPITEEFFHQDLRIDLFNENQLNYDIVTPLNNTFSIR